MGTWGTGAFDSDAALDLLDSLARQGPAQRRRAVERVFRTAGEPVRGMRPGEVVAAAALVAAGLPAGADSAREITRLGYDAAALVPADAPGLAGAALAALLAVAGPDGPWCQGWVSEALARQARRTAGELAAALSACPAAARTETDGREGTVAAGQGQGPEP
jgi:hypothetical protein